MPRAAATISSRASRGSAPPSSPPSCGASGARVVLAVLPPVLGLALFVVIWALHRAARQQLPGPAKTWASAVEVFSDPFYRKGPNDQGIGWNILTSLQRVGIGFGLAALIGIPAGLHDRPLRCS